jgi:hypothetical protein
MHAGDEATQLRSVAASPTGSVQTAEASADLTQAHGTGEDDDDLR